MKVFETGAHYSVTALRFVATHWFAAALLTGLAMGPNLPIPHLQLLWWPGYALFVPFPLGIVGGLFLPRQRSSMSHLVWLTATGTTIFALGWLLALSAFWVFGGPVTILAMAGLVGVMAPMPGFLFFMGALVGQLVRWSLSDGRAVG
jgi:hypothetical protein